MKKKDSNEIPEGATRHQLIVGGQGHRTNLDREQDVWYAVAELAKGRSYREIASSLSEKKNYKISFQQIYKDVQEVLVEWKRENMENIDAYIAKDLARLEEIERIVLQNFEKSKLPRPNEYAALIKRGYTPEEIDQMYEERGGYAGDPRYLETLLHLQKQRMDLLGISKGNDVPQQTIINYGFNNVDFDALAKMADNLQDNHSRDIDEQ